MHLWLLLSAALAFVPQRSLPAIRGLQAVVEDIDALSFRELQAACAASSVQGYLADGSMHDHQARDETAAEEALACKLRDMGFSVLPCC